MRRNKHRVTKTIIPISENCQTIKVLFMSGTVDTAPLFATTRNFKQTEYGITVKYNLWRRRLTIVGYKTTALAQDNDGTITVCVASHLNSHATIDDVQEMLDLMRTHTTNGGRFDLTGHGFPEASYDPLTPGPIGRHDL